jgi:hypothetical protein
MCIIKFTSRPTPFYFIVVKPYLRPELIKKPTPYDAVKHKEPTQINKPIPPLQEATPQLVLKRGRGCLYKYPLLIAIADIIIYLQDDAT